MGSQQQQQFCLRWNNHQTNLLSVFDDLLQHETLVDVTLACEGLSMRAHKVVLSACSPYFQQLFLENPCKHPIVVLKDISYTDMKTLIDFMYKGEVNVSHEQLSTLLSVADTLKVKGLAEVTEGMAARSAETDQEMPPVLEAQSLLAARRGATSPPTPRRRKRRRTSGGSNNSGQSEDVEPQAEGEGANDLNGETHSLDLPIVPKMEVIDVSYEEEEDEQENMPTLRVSDVQGAREVHGSKVGDGAVTGSSSMRNYSGGDSAKDKHRRETNDEEKFTTDDDDAIEITDLPFTQHLTIEPTASTSSVCSLMSQGPSTSSSHPTNTDRTLYFPSTSASSSLPIYDAPPLPPLSTPSTAAASAFNTQALRARTARREPYDDDGDSTLCLFGTGSDLLQTETFPKSIEDCYEQTSYYDSQRRKCKIKVKCLFCSKLFYNKLYNMRRHLLSGHVDIYNTIGHDV